MVDVEIQTELTQVNTQLEQLVTQLNQINAQRDQLTQQIHNLNGIAMYLRGKLDSTPQEAETSSNNVSNTEIPDIAEIVNDV